MKNLLRNKSGFTMVELMVVVIIVAILAAAAIPFYTANIKKAIRTEAVATLGAIRSAERIYRSEYDGYSNNLTSAQIASVLGVDATDAHYFDINSYTVTGNGSTTFTGTCTSKSTNTAPGAPKVLKHWANGTVVVTITQDGIISEF